ncbi:hypothetical protein MRX96_036192 [Rhipicephalus microplus]
MHFCELTMIHKSVLLALFTFALGYGFATKNAKVNLTAFEFECNKSIHRMYPDACWNCPPNITLGYIRKPMFYYNISTNTCIEDIGESPSCNSFDDYDDCLFYCGLYYYDEYEEVDRK